MADAGWFGWGQFVGLSAIAAVLGGAWVTVEGPYGLAKPMPPQCTQEQICVVVAGLDDDVTIGLGAGGQTFGFDLNDQGTRRVLEWLNHSPPPGPHIDVYRFPREIAMPEQSTVNTAQQEREAIARARELGHRFHAKLVVLGSVDGDSRVRLAFIDPDRLPEHLYFGEYELGGLGTPDTLQSDYRAAVAAALGNEAAPIPVVLRPAPTRIAPRPGIEPVPDGDDTTLENTATTQPISTTQPSQGPVIEGPTVYSRPTPSDLARYYPHGHAQGSATVQCIVGLDRKLRDCHVTAEDPPEHGIGQAAVNLAEHGYRYNPQKMDGQPVDGGTAAINITFQ